jgi:hypothetical protein
MAYFFFFLLESREDEEAEKIEAVPTVVPVWTLLPPLFSSALPNGMTLAGRATRLLPTALLATGKVNSFCDIILSKKTLRFCVWR